MWKWEDIREDDPNIHAYSECDQLLFEVYGDTIHRNTGDHMPGGIDIVQDAFWRQQYTAIVNSNISLVDLPSGKVTEKFIITARDKFEGVRLCKWNLERVV